MVIGAGQAGLSASYHLRRRGIEHVVLDADDAPGGAWQHRWDSLTMHDVHGVAALPDSRAARRPAGRANEVVPAYFADVRAHPRLAGAAPGAGGRGTDDGGLLVVRAGDRSLDEPHPRERDRDLVAAVRAALPGHGDVPRRAAAHRRLPGPGALPRPTGRGGGRRCVGRAAPRRARPGHRHRSGSPGASRSGAPTTSPRGRTRGGRAGRGTGTPRPAAGQRRQRHRARPARAGARGRAARRLRAAPDVHRDRARRRAVAPTARFEPADVILWATGFRPGGRPPRAAAPALARTAASSSTAPPRSPTRGSSWSATAPRRAPSAPTGRAGWPPAASPAGSSSTRSTSSPGGLSPTRRTAPRTATRPRPGTPPRGSPRRPGRA